MAIPCPTLKHGAQLVVGSAATDSDLLSVTPGDSSGCGDLLEVRLDLLEQVSARPWQHLRALPILFTARRAQEGGHGELSAVARMELLSGILDEASLIDIEVASIPEMTPLIAELGEKNLPWIASFHDFEALPPNAVMAQAANKAKEAGATAFKVAAQLGGEGDLERLIEFQGADHGLPVASMGMGELAARSRVECALAGSVLNYGYIGETPTAPGQMSAAQLKQAILKAVE